MSEQAVAARFSGMTRSYKVRTQAACRLVGADHAHEAAHGASGCQQ